MDQRTADKTEVRLVPIVHGQLYENRVDSATMFPQLRRNQASPCALPSGSTQGT